MLLANRLFENSIAHAPPSEDGVSPPTPDPEFVAQQLRKPSGDFAHAIADKMDQVNKPLFDVTLETMQLQDHESILEIGFGSGAFFTEVLNEAEGLSICGIDHSQEMVEKATTYNEAVVDSGKLNLQSGNSDDLPYAAHSFDKVYCNMVVYFWDQPESHLREIYRVLKPGGLFFTGMRTKESMLQLPFVEHGFRLYDQEQWCNQLQAQGFKVQKAEISMDPRSEIDDQDIQMESICIVAEKIQA